MHLEPRNRAPSLHNHRFIQMTNIEFLAETSAKAAQLFRPERGEGGPLATTLRTGIASSLRRNCGTAHESGTAADCYWNLRRPDSLIAISPVSLLNLLQTQHGEVSAQLFRFNQHGINF